jgi:ATP-dependent DNA helicase RecG
MNVGYENEKVEFKKSTGELKEAVVSIGAILNKHSEGTLYFGVDDNGTVIGQHIGAATVKDVSRKVYEQIRPTPNISVDILYDNDKKYIRVAFDGKGAPYAVNGRYFMRTGNESREMTQEQLRDLFYDTGDNSDWENTLTKYTVDDIDDELLISCYKAGVKSGRIKDDYDKERMLSKFGLYADGYLTNAGNCLLSKHKPVKLKLALFATDARIEFLDLDHFQGNIIECIDEADLFIKKSMRWGAKFSDIVRTEVPEVPVAAIHEIVLNAFVHAMYKHASLSAHEVDITPSRIAIFNPGRLPSNIVPEDYLKGNMGSYLRNPAIAEFMFRCNIIEAFGTGFHKVITLCNENAIRYDHYNDMRGFTFEFMRNPLFVTENVPVPMGSELEVYRLLRNEDFLTAEVIAERIGRDIRTVFRKIDGLKEKGLIKREGNVRKGHWAILPVPFDVNTLLRDGKKRRREK